MQVLLREGETEEFNQQRTNGKNCSLHHADLCSSDLRGLVADGLDLSHAKLRTADLRGIDFRTATLDGANIQEAKISGTYFPHHLSAQDILLSLQHGTPLKPL
jgi:uncharacterized protein YjbI with pentapeptide repeats